jgi:L-alanine-DL-glutamate epimerase-like enolase superfamily enzyme
MRNLILLILLFFSFNLAAQDIGLPVYRFTTKTVFDDSISFYTYVPSPSESLDKEVYITLHGICVEVWKAFFGHQVEKCRVYLKSRRYLEVGYNKFLSPDARFIAEIEYNEGYTAMKFRRYGS